MVSAMLLARTGEPVPLSFCLNQLLSHIPRAGDAHRVRDIGDLGKTAQSLRIGLRFGIMDWANDHVHPNGRVVMPHADP